jgi:transcriptional regulator with XRE-family HTH domain
MDNLKALQARHAWTIDQLAEYLGVHPAALSNWLHGRRAAPDSIARLVYVLSVVETLAPEIHAALMPGPAKLQGKRGRKSASSEN